MGRAVWAMALCSVAARASASDIVGKVTIRGAPTAQSSEAAREQELQRSSDPYAESYPDVPTPPPRAIATIGAVEDVVVSLEEVPQGATPPAHPALVLAQTNKQFAPRVLAVPVGGTVDFPNHDGFFHNVFSLSRPKEFDLGRYKNGESRKVTFDKTGVVKVFCEIHSQMKAYIVVVPNGFYTMPGADGAFVLKGVPPGQYNLVVWHPSRSAKVLPVAVPQSGAASVVVEL